jgi:hypothetical protein
LNAISLRELLRVFPKDNIHVYIIHNYINGMHKITETMRQKMIKNDIQCANQFYFWLNLNMQGVPEAKVGPPKTKFWPPKIKFRPPETTFWQSFCMCLIFGLG